MELNDGKIKILAYYLPQFHPTPENDEWWGTGFTEWTNVGKAKPLFRGHYQPKIPADLGYYDLRIQEVAERQTELAVKAGITGFCYWHYWFGNGKKLLEMPAERMLRTGTPNYPFCFAWANHGWWKKSWDPNGSSELLIEQEYPGISDIDAHFYYCLPFFKDERYMRYNDKLIFVIYKHIDYKNIEEFICRWNKLAKENGFSEGFYFITGLLSFDTLENAKHCGLDGGILDVNARETLIPPVSTRILNRIRGILGINKYLFPKRISYDNLIKQAWENDIFDSDDVVPMILPNWDHTPRSGKFGTVYTDATPENFGRMLDKIIPRVNKKNNKLVILKSWNEWGEGNYMEPDTIFGHGFIDTLSRKLREYEI